MLHVRQVIKAAALVLLCSVIGFGQSASKPNSVKQSCKSNPKLSGKCFQIHGRAFVSNGTPDLRIWQVGTKRILGVTASAIADDAEDPIAPANLLRALDADKHFVFGDFELCPFTQRREDHMQMVCVESAKKLVSKPYGYGTKP